MRPHSAIVEMLLVVNNHTYKVNQMGSDFLILDDGPTANSGSIGWLTVSIDGESTTRKVLLPIGICFFVVGGRTPIAKI